MLKIQPLKPVLLAGLLAPLSALGDIRLNLEEPVNYGTASGVTNVRGWAIADAGIDRVELYVDGEYAGEIPYGGERADVAAVFPDVEGADESGFGKTFNFGNLGPGEHTMTVRAYDDNDDMLEDSATFQVVSFSDSFLVGEQPFDLTDADVELNRQTGVITLEDIRLDGVEYDLSLEWSEASQSFVMKALWVADDDSDDDLSDDDDDRDDSGEFEFEGVVDAVTPGSSITVAGMTYTVDASTAYFIDNVGQVDGDTFFATVVVGDTVEVTDYLPEDGVADELYLEDPDD